jgi:quercetin dioxygenase-like cupin family protein
MPAAVATSDEDVRLDPEARAIRALKQDVARANEGPVVVRRADRALFQARQGKLLFYLCPNNHRDTALQAWRVFIQEIRTCSGKHRHAGGLTIFVLEGHGYTIVDGERWDWKKGDLVLLPMKVGGVEHQHFNLGPPEKPAVWIAMINMAIHDYLASDLEQIENSPDYKG